MKHILCIILCLAAALSSVGAKPKSGKTFLIFSAVVSGTPISIYGADQPFDPSRHLTTPYKPATEDGGKDWELATIDGKTVVGSDGKLPNSGRSQLGRLYVIFGEKRIDVPQCLLSHVFDPCLGRASFDHHYAGTIVSVSADGRAVLIDLAVGQGGGSGTYSIYVGADGTCKHELPDRPGSE